MSTLKNFKNGILQYLLMLVYHVLIKHISMLLNQIFLAKLCLEKNTALNVSESKHCDDRENKGFPQFSIYAHVINLR